MITLWNVTSSDDEALALTLVCRDIETEPKIKPIRTMWLWVRPAEVEHVSGTPTGRRGRIINEDTAGIWI